jgi:hypothetical protein
MSALAAIQNADIPRAVVDTSTVRTHLTFDGSYLGEHEFMSVVSYCFPCTKVTAGQKPVSLYAKIMLPGMTDVHYVILKRNCTGKTDQLICDELKPIFGLQKMGSHSIRLRGVPRKYDPKHPWIIDGPQGPILNTYIEPQWSDYFIFRATTSLNGEGNRIFVPLHSLKDTVWFDAANPSSITPGQKLFAYEIRKIFVFRDLLRISDTNLLNILVKNFGSEKSPDIKPLSIDEMTIKGPNEKYRKLSKEVDEFFFPKTTTRTEVLIKMLGLTQERYREQVEALRNSMSQIISRIDGEKLWLVDDVISQIIDRCTIYYDLINENK